MRELLAQLEDLNTTCRIHLANLLFHRHHIENTGAYGKHSGKCGRGGVFFVAFDPWDACWRQLPGSHRYFQAAERSGLFHSEDAEMLSEGLIRLGVNFQTTYTGRFSPFFRDARVKPIFEYADKLDDLSASGLAIGASWVDRLFEACPLPLLPEKHFNILSFRDIPPEIIEFSVNSTWLAWAEALDLSCLGPWVGFKPHEIIQALTTFRVRGTSRPTLADVENRVFGQSVWLPLFSHGLQGCVFGFFCGIPKDQKEPILSTLMQFGQTLADAYSALRVRRFTEALHAKLTVQTLAQEVICITSPVSKVIVMRDGERFGYKLVYEHNYWGGYDPIPAHELEASVSTCGFTLDLPNGASVYIEPLTDIANFDAEFAKMRLESCLRNALASRVQLQIHSTLTLNDVKKLKNELLSYADDGAASVRKLRQYYIVCRVEEHWQNGGTKIFNIHLKAFLEDKKGRKLRSGYQASSFLDEVERLFANKIGVTKTRKGLSLSWDSAGVS